MVVIFLLAGLAMGQAASFFDPMSESTLVLPENSGIETRWVVPPTTIARPIPKHTLNEIKFSVDALGVPWIGIDNRQLLNPVKEVTAVLSEPFQGFTHLDNGLMLLTTVRTIGFIGSSNKEEFDGNGLPILPFQPICDLPAYYSRIYRGAGNCVFLVSENAATKKNAIYLLRPETGADGGMAELGSFRKVFESGEAITAVAGDDTGLFIALGKMVVMLNLADNKLVAIPAQPDEEVRELAYKQGVGLFYAGASGVGFLGAKRAFRFIETSHARIGLHGETLLVLFPRNLGVMAFDNVKKLWDFDYALAPAGE